MVTIVWENEMESFWGSSNSPSSLIFASLRLGVNFLREGVELAAETTIFVVVVGVYFPYS